MLAACAANDRPVRYSPFIAARAADAHRADSLPLAAASGGLPREPGATGIVADAGRRGSVEGEGFPKPSEARSGLTVASAVGRRDRRARCELGETARNGSPHVLLSINQWRRPCE